jgi:hypothetical protein
MLGPAADPNQWHEVIVETQVPVILNLKPAPLPGEEPAKVSRLVSWGIACQLACNFDVLPGRYLVEMEGSRIVSGSQTLDLRSASAFEMLPGDADGLDVANSLELMGVIATIAGAAGAVVGGILWATSDPGGEVTGQGLFGGGAGAAAVGTALMVGGAVMTSQNSTRLVPKELPERGLRPLPNSPLLGEEPPSE